MNDRSVTFVAHAVDTKVSGEISVPGDKSISHRSIMFGAMATGTTRVSGFLNGEDNVRTLDAFRDMGVNIEWTGGTDVVIHGKGISAIENPANDIYLGNAGTAIRLMVGVLAGLGIHATLSGDESLNSRPMARVVDPLRTMGANIEAAESGTPPLRLKGETPLKAIEYSCPMASAQVKSCLLLAGLHAKGTTVVNEPDVTRDHTERMLRGFGVNVQSDGLTVSIEGGQSLTATDVVVPGDISSSAFFIVAASMVPGSNLLITQVGLNPTRTGVIDIMRLMGADISVENEMESGGEIIGNLRIRGTQLKGIDVPEQYVSLAIDEFPAIFVAASTAIGTTRVTGAEELRVKETDRIQVMADGLQALGVDITATDDGAVINGGPISGGIVDSCGDHRTAMAFAIASLRSEGDITIMDCANVNTSFPGFANLANSVGLNLDTDGDLA